MKAFLAFILPPALALTGNRLNLFLFGRDFEKQFGIGFRFALGLAAGMLLFSQAALLGALSGIKIFGLLAWGAIVVGVFELAFLVPKCANGLKQFKFRPAYLWLLLLLPVIYSWWVFGRLSTLEGTLEFDANAFWVFKSKVLYLEQGRNLLPWLHNPELAYAHWDYPMLVTCLYTLDYGLVGGVDEFVNKVWPFWMVVALCLGMLSLGKVWKRPHPLPAVTVVAFCFLPASLQFIRQEGGAIPMVFYTSLAALLMVTAICRADELPLAAAMLVLAGCAMTKFEGVIYAAAWFCVSLPFCRQHGWLKKPILWKSVLITFICLLPYVWYRCSKPIPYPLSDWWRTGISLPKPVLTCLPQAWFLNVVGRFFNSDFFHWQPVNGNHLQWAGKWTGPGVFVNEQLDLLPWLLLILLALSLWKKRARLAVGSLTIVMLGIFTVLSLVIVCLAYTQSDVPNVVDLSYVLDYSTSNQVGRYFYPFFTAWFLAVAATWFDNLQPAPSANAPKTPRAPVWPRNTARSQMQ